MRRVDHPVNYPDPEEQPRQGRSQDGSGDGMADTDAAFARIVAGLRAEAGPSWCDADAPDDAREEHFDPPDPPPLPIPRIRTVGGVLALGAGVLLLAAPGLLGLGERVGTPLGLVTLAAGIGWLLMGLRPDSPAGGSDDGARL